MKEDIAWAAGLWEGEGSAELHGYKQKLAGGKEVIYYYPRLMVSNTDISLLARFRVVVGTGTVRIGRRARENYKTQFMYSVHGEKAQRVAALLFPLVTSEYRRGQLKSIIGNRENRAIDGRERSAWAAGIFEGEGWAGVYFHSRKSRGGYYLVDGEYKRGSYEERVSIANTQKDIIISVVSALGFGRIGTETKVKGNRKTKYTYETTTKAARRFTKEILPFVISNDKREQLRSLLTFDSRHKRGKWRGLTLTKGARTWREKCFVNSFFRSVDKLNADEEKRVKAT